MAQVEQYNTIQLKQETLTKEALVQAIPLLTGFSDVFVLSRMF
jgi:hypothetical protein